MVLSLAWWLVRCGSGAAGRFWPPLGAGSLPTKTWRVWENELLNNYGDAIGKRILFMKLSDHDS